MSNSHRGLFQFSTVAFVLSCIHTPLVFAQAPSPELRNTASEAWTRLKLKAAVPLSATATVVKTDTVNEKPKITTFRLKQNHNSYLFEVLVPSGVAGDRLQHRQVYSSNSRYSFIAVDRGSGWVVTLHDSSPERTVHLQATAKKLGIDYLQSAWTVGGHTLPELFDAPGFKLFSLLPTESNPTTHMQLAFAVPMPSNPSKEMKVGIDKGTVEFDMTHDWRISKYECELPASLSGGTISANMAYREADGLLQRFEHTMNLHANYQAKTVITTDNLEFREVPEYEFTLSAYGLPEPPGVTWEHPTLNYVWLLLAAGIFGIIALSCRWLLKRRAKAVPPPPPATA